MSRLRSVRGRSQQLAYFITVPLAVLTLTLVIAVAQSPVLASVTVNQLPIAALFVGLFILAQATVLHFEVRRHSLIVTVGEIPLLLALFYLSHWPLLVIAVRLLSVLAVQTWQRFSIVKQIRRAHV